MLVYVWPQRCLSSQSFLIWGWCSWQKIQLMPFTSIQRIFPLYIEKPGQLHLKNNEVKVNWINITYGITSIYINQKCNLVLHQQHLFQAHKNAVNYFRKNTELNCIDSSDFLMWKKKMLSLAVLSQISICRETRDKIFLITYYMNQNRTVIHVLAYNYQEQMKLII